MARGDMSLDDGLTLISESYSESTTKVGNYAILVRGWPRHTVILFGQCGPEEMH